MFHLLSSKCQIHTLGNRLIIVLISLLLGSSAAYADDPEKKSDPLWELGAGISIFSVPHYLGSDQSTTYTFPFPYFIYRGERLQADREGLKGLLFDSERLDINVSLGGSLPVDDDDNDARQGMQDLDLLLEAGPNFEYLISKTEIHLWRIDLPIRGAFSMGSEFLNHEGWTANPRIYHRYQSEQWRVISTLGTVYSDSRYHGYFYNVATGEVTESRPEFHSDAGYTGAKFTVTALREFGHWMIGGNYRYYDLSGASNEDSPLMIQDDYTSLTLFIAWRFYKSED